MVVTGVVVEQHLAAMARREGLKGARRSSIAAQAKALQKAGLLAGAHYREIRRLAKLVDRSRKGRGPAPGRKQVGLMIARAQELVRETL